MFKYSIKEYVIISLILIFILPIAFIITLLLSPIFILIFLANLIENKET